MEILPVEVFSLVIHQLPLSCIGRVAVLSSTYNAMIQVVISENSFCNLHLEHPYKGPDPLRLLIGTRKLSIEDIASLNYAPYTEYLFKYYPLELFIAALHNTDIVVDLDGLAGALVAKLPSRRITGDIGNVGHKLVPSKYRALFATYSRVDEWREVHQRLTSHSALADNSRNDHHSLATYQYNEGMRSDLIFQYLTPSYHCRVSIEG